ncbi:uncharacterized protein K460DRAFT_289503 [Cucurbitaria berberidis CBS 394.84]|uniref:RING-type domain-containing protein n=1 Tax=Cucurbitaria berberidis CBS 394.84 TaxID=1168544 RepID=A0A9P4GDX7_9PLEO|nr:uncharacterized protein K460DRAFT_289503 [Cucurbitaria berberidis CBS 394.84]KAF1843704.1 hypothetical protein K460DRAFT_289503 [Cucurbitaria berberidis CBS 394.84]
MTISKSRGATKKLGPISIGSKIVRFKIPNLDRRFTVHEDLICRTSTFFKTRLQKRRKILNDQDECCVCAEALNPHIKDLTFCIKCGQNVHETCIETWKRSFVHQGYDKPPPTCPMCRATWKNEPLLKYLGVEGDLDAEAVQAYLDWLYCSSLHIDKSVSRKTDAFNVALLKVWEVANAVEDETFKNEIIRTFFTEARACFWSDSVKWAFTQSKRSEEIKAFVIEVFMAYMEPGWFKKEAAKWPDVFTWELADVAMARGERKSFKELEERHCKAMGTQDEGGFSGESSCEIDSDDELSGVLGQPACDALRDRRRDVHQEADLSLAPLPNAGLPSLSRPWRRK